jgi:hypothetical protein
MEAAIIIALAVVAFALIIIPVVRGAGGATDSMSTEPVEQQIERYRTALRADTLCRKCGQANPPGSRYCYDCGRPLAAADAEEFDGTEAA